MYLDPDIWATQMPAEVFYSERVLASTVLVGASGQTAIEKRTGWEVGLWGFGGERPSGAPGLLPAAAALDGWYRCTGFGSDGKPDFAEDPARPTLADRPDLTYTQGQPVAHGILREVGALSSRADAITLTVKAASGAVKATYAWSGERNGRGEYVLRTAESAPHPVRTARACPATRAVWIDRVPEGDTPYAPGDGVWADYWVTPPPDEKEIVDATPELQRILIDEEKSVVLGEGTYYARTFDAPGGGIEIRELLGIRGIDERIPTKRGFAYVRKSVLRVWPGMLGGLVKGDIRPNAGSSQEPQNGASLKRLTVYGSVDSIDLLGLDGEPPGIHHGVEFAAVTDIVCEGVRFFRCIDDGLKLDRRKPQQGASGTLTVAPDGGTFAIPVTPAGPNMLASPPIREGLTKIETNPNVGSAPFFVITIPVGASFPNQKGEMRVVEGTPLKLYAANATEPRGGVAPIGYFTAPNTPHYTDFGRPLSTYVVYDDDGGVESTDEAYANALGWLDPLAGTGCMENSHPLPTSPALPVDYRAVGMVSNATPLFRECEFSENGRNGFTLANSESATAVEGLLVRGNGVLATSIGLSGAFAADLQLGTTARFAVEQWQDIAASDIELVGSGDSAMKIGQEAGPRYRLGGATYTRTILRDCAGKGIRTNGYNCGPLVFDDLRASNCLGTTLSIKHAGRVDPDPSRPSGGTLATTLVFDNPKPPHPDGDDRADGEPTFDVDAAVPDIIVSNDAYHPEKYAAGVRHELRDIQGIQPNQAYVAISAGGVIIDGATDVHFEVRVQGSAFSSECYDGPDPTPPPVEFRGTFTRCTFDPPRP